VLPWVRSASATGSIRSPMPETRMCGMKILSRRTRVRASVFQGSRGGA
jgi:hypothetical protein